MTHKRFCHTAISQFLMADISFNIACKELKIAQILQLNKLFQLLHLVHKYGRYDLSSMLMRKNLTNDVSKDSLIELEISLSTTRALIGYFEVTCHLTMKLFPAKISERNDVKG